MLRISARTKIVLLLLVMAAGFGLFLRITSFHIVKTTPSLSRITNADSHLDIHFNKPLDQKTLNVSSEPDIIGSYKLISPKLLRVTWAYPLSVGTKYNLKLTNLKSTDNHLMKKTLSFKPKVLNFNNLSPQQKTSIVNSQDNLPSDNLYHDLPHYDPYYKLEAKPNGTARPTIVFTYLAPPADMVNSAPDKAAALGLAKLWLAGKGVSLSRYQFIDLDTGNPL